MDIIVTPNRESGLHNKSNMYKNVLSSHAIGNIFNNILIIICKLLPSKTISIDIRQFRTYFSIFIS